MPIEEEIRMTSIDELNLSVRATNVLSNAGIKTISDFILFDPEKLCRLKNAGKKTINEIGNVISSKVNENKEKLLPEVQCILFEANRSKATFEQLIKSSFTEKLFNTPIEELNLSTRAFNALIEEKLRTIKNIIDFGLQALKKKKNVGRKTINNIKNAILSIIEKGETYSRVEICFIDALNSILSSINPKHLSIIKARYGYEDRKSRTLEEIGSKIGVTRERVRQVIMKELGRIKHSSKRNALQTIIENIERLLLQYKGIISINDIAKDKYFISGTRNQLRFLVNQIAELYEERYRIIDKYFLTSLSDDEINVIQSKIREAALKCKFPIDEKAFIEHIISFVGLISKNYLSYHLLYGEHIVISKGKVLSPGKLSIPQRVKLIMKDINRPMHFTEIVRLYRNHFGDIKIMTKDLERAIHARIGDSKDFIIVGPGTFMLRDRFKTPENINQIVEKSKEILQSLKTISDTKYLISELRKRNIDIGGLNEYSLKPILLKYSGFIKYRKFEIGIEELTNKYKRRPLSNLIYEILLSNLKPMHVKTIWKEIQKQRGFPEYAIGQRLYDDPRFIKVGSATYTVKENILSYEEKRKIIVNFAKEWIQLKGTAISAFFVSEVLKAIEEIKDFPLGLVEHVLATSPEFTKLQNGFYDLAYKDDTRN